MMKGKLSQMNRIALIFHTRVSACVFSRAADCEIPAAVHVSRATAGMLLARPLCCESSIVRYGSSGVWLFPSALAPLFGNCCSMRASGSHVSPRSLRTT